MKIQCEIIRDILPLYAEDMVSQPTREMVEEHLADCEDCSRELDALKNQNVPVESGVKSLNRVKDAIRRRRILAVMAVFFFLATVLTGGALLLDANIYLSVEDAVEEIWIEGDTVRIRWNEGIIGTGRQYYTEDPSNYAVVAWTNLQKILMPTQRVPYEALDEEVKKFISEEQYAELDSTSTYQVADAEKVNFWYYDMAKRDTMMVLDGHQPMPDQPLYQDSNHIRAYVYGFSGICVLFVLLGICFLRHWFGHLALRLGILAGSCSLSAVIVTAGQLVDIYGRFTEMLVDSSIVVLPMTLFGMCVMQLIQLNRQDKGL